MPPSAARGLPPVPASDSHRRQRPGADVRCLRRLRHAASDCAHRGEPRAFSRSISLTITDAMGAAVRLAAVHAESGQEACDNTIKSLKIAEHKIYSAGHELPGRLYLVTASGVGLLPDGGAGVCRQL